MKPLRRWEYAPAPRFAPERDPRYMSEVDAITRTARLMGVEPMPHQTLIYDLGTQYRVNAFGQRIYKYSTVLVTLPRQSGKTTLLMPLFAYRAMRHQDRKMWFTAQTGAAASARMKDLIKILRKSPLSDMFGYVMSNGATGIKCKATETALTMFAPTDGAVHGETTIMAAYDEIWKFSQEQGDTIDGAIGPAMITLGAQAQKWMTSTVGTAFSTYMNPIMENGRARADNDLCYIEYSLDPDLDPMEPANWWTFHPALGNTIDESDIIKERQRLKVTEFLRAYCNIIAGSEDPIISDETWKAQALPEVHNLAGADTLRLAIEVAPDNACAAIVAAWQQDTGPCVRVVHRAPGSSWLPAKLARTISDITERGVRVTLHADGAGPVRRITADWNAQRNELGDDLPHMQALGTAGFGAAVEHFLVTAGDDKTLAHDGSELLAAEVQAAVMRTYNGVRMLSRDKSPVPIPSLIASCVALWALGHPDETPEELPPLIL